MKTISERKKDTAAWKGSKREMEMERTKERETATDRQTDRQTDKLN